MIVKAEEIFIKTLLDSYDVIDVLKQRREYLGLSRELVSKRLGHRPELVGRWEDRITTPSTDNFLSWAKILELDVILCPKELGGESKEKGFRAKGRVSN